MPTPPDTPVASEALPGDALDERPLIDRLAPAKYETATFALG